jgi:hypothetical protein
MTASDERLSTTIHRQGSENSYFPTLRKWLNRAIFPIIGNDRIITFNSNKADADAR